MHASFLSMVFIAEQESNPAVLISTMLLLHSNNKRKRPPGPAWQRLQALYTVVGTPAVATWPERPHRAPVGRNCMSDAQVQQLGSAFLVLDLDGDGVVSALDVAGHVGKQGVELTVQQAAEIVARVTPVPRASKPEPSVAELGFTFVDFVTFLRWKVCDLHGVTESTSSSMVFHRLLASQRADRLDEACLDSAIDACGLGWTGKQRGEMWNQLDPSGRGAVSLSEFSSYFSQGQRPANQTVRRQEHYAVSPLAGAQYTPRRNYSNGALSPRGGRTYR